MSNKECNECHKRHDKRMNRRDDSDCNTPKIIAIENPCETVLFRKVSIPASMGDDITNPPVQGKYRNVLMVYEANGHSYLYDSGGIATLIGEGAATATGDFDQLINRPKYAGQVMTSDTNIPDVSAIDQALDDEISNRTEADELISIEVNNESVARQQADTALGEAISAEENARIQADSEIEEALDEKVNASDLSTVATSGDYTDLSNTPTNLSDFNNDENYQTDTEVATSIAEAIAPIDEAINKTVVTDLTVDSTASTTTINMTESKQNIKTGATSSSTIPMPVASSTQAGVMNSATFDAVQSNSNNIDAILNGSVAISGLPSSPTKAQLTAAWQTATGLSTLINTAKIYDSTNEKTWTYYENVDQWYSAGAGGSVTVNQWTNSAAGIVKGSTTDGQIFAEADGTGSVNGWDAMANAVSTNTSNIANKVDKEVGKGLSTNDYTTTEKNKLAGIEAGAEVNDPNTVIDASYVHTDNNYTTAEKTKLTGIEDGAEVNVLEGVQIAGTDLSISNKKVNIPYSASGTAGVVKPANGASVSASGELQADTRTYAQYGSDPNSEFIGKGTLENAIVGKKLVNETTMDAAVQSAVDLLVSRGEQLVINGSGFLGDNTNFSQLEFDGSQANGSIGSFTSTNKSTTFTALSTYSFPVNPNLTYMLECDLKSLEQAAYIYYFLAYLDCDGKEIFGRNGTYVPDTLTTLTQDLEDGDTVVHLNDLTNWKLNGNQFERGMIFWNYTNSKGYTYPELTYSRNVYQDIYTGNASIDKANKTITLSSPWDKGTISAGTKLSQSSASGSRKYPSIKGAVPTTWTHYSVGIEGTDYSGTNVQNMFFPGAAYCKIGFLWNYGTHSTTDQVWVTNISVRSVSPTVSNPTLTLTQGGNTLGTFSPNTGDNSTIDIPSGGGVQIIEAPASSIGSVPYDTDTTIQSVTLPAGKWMLFTNIPFWVIAELHANGKVTHAFYVDGVIVESTEVYNSAHHVYDTPLAETIGSASYWNMCNSAIVELESSASCSSVLYSKIGSENEYNDALRIHGHYEDYEFVSNASFIAIKLD